jgi:hypothetical protein
MTWRFLAFDLVTEASLGELTVAEWRSTDDLNDAGSFDATLILDEPAATFSVITQPAELLTDDDGAVLTDDDGDPLLAVAEEEMQVTRERNVATIEACRPGKTLIVAEREGEPLFSAIPWRRKYTAATRTFQIAGRGFGSYFDHFTQGTDYTPVGIDQLIIFNILAVGATGDIITHGETSGQVRDREYLRLAGKTRGELMRELAAVIGGFDFDFRTEYDGDTAERHLRLFYPRRGRPATTSEVQFRIPGNASLISVDEDATNIAAEVQMVGAGEGVTLLETTATSTEMTVAGYPNYRTQLARKDISVLDTLVQTADAELRDRSVVDRETFVIDVDQFSEAQPFGSWDLGDDAYLVIEDDPRFPAQTDGSPGLVTTRRIVSHTWSVTGPEGNERLEVGLDLVSAVRSDRRPALVGVVDAGDVDKRLRELEGY